jgi:hypothetical protein
MNTPRGYPDVVRANDDAALVITIQNIYLRFDQTVLFLDISSNTIHILNGSSETKTQQVMECASQPFNGGVYGYSVLACLVVDQRTKTPEWADCMPSDFRRDSFSSTGSLMSNDVKPV